MESTVIAGRQRLIWAWYHQLFGDSVSTPLSLMCTSGEIYWKSTLSKPNNQSLYTQYVGTL